ncbi:hypothetical protein Q2941_45785, partial [Bradyrhizobium sp. UFLA05-153]
LHNRILAHVKSQRQINRFRILHGRLSGFDDQTPETIVATADRLNAIGVDVPFLSILTPFRGTPLYEEHLSSRRILVERDWPHYNGYSVAFEPARMSPDELLQAHRALWKRAFGPKAVFQRLAGAAGRLNRGGLMLAASMNGFYGLKRLTGNLPIDPPTIDASRIRHPFPDERSAQPELVTTADR